jgi:Fe2+ or Zn2+ uptake regulation protein
MKNPGFIEKSIDILKASGCRITDARRMVIDILSRAEKPLQAADIFNQAKKKESSIDLVSVYRILDLMAEKELVHRDLESGGYFPCSHCSDCPENVHVFIKCSDCSSISEVDFHGEIFSPEFKSMLKKSKTRPESETVFLSNTCRKCVG